jgi:hypothetical protein
MTYENNTKAKQYPKNSVDIYAAHKKFNLRTNMNRAVICLWISHTQLQR